MDNILRNSELRLMLIEHHPDIRGYTLGAFASLMVYWYSNYYWHIYKMRKVFKENKDWLTIFNDTVDMFRFLRIEYKYKGMRKWRDIRERMWE